MKHPARHVVIGALLGGCICACTTYQPPKLPPRQLATVIPSEHSSEEHLYIGAVDGLPVSAASAFNLHTGERGVYLAPGRHTLSIHQRFGIADTDIQIWLLVRAGRTYRVESLGDAYGFSARAVDLATGAVVGGAVDKR